MSRAQTSIAPEQIYFPNDTIHGLSLALGFAMNLFFIPDLEVGLKFASQPVVYPSHSIYWDSKLLAPAVYSHLSNKRGGGAKFAKSLNMEVGINV